MTLREVKTERRNLPDEIQREKEKDGTAKFNKCLLSTDARAKNYNTNEER